jgi:putative transposase
MFCATKVRLYPTPEQAEFLGRQFGAVRFVYNRALAVKRHRYRVHGQKLSAVHDLKKLLPVAKKSRRYKWLADYDAMALQQAYINLDKAFRNFFEGRAKYPRFKRKHGQQSSYHCSGKIAVLQDSILLPKMDQPIRAVIHREVQGKLKSITVTRTPTGKYFAALLFEDGKAKPAPVRGVPEDSIVGVDVGLIDLAVESNGRSGRCATCGASNGPCPERGRGRETGPRPGSGSPRRTSAWRTHDTTFSTNSPDA